MTHFSIDLVLWGDEQKSSWLFALLMLISRVGEAQRILIHCTIFLMKWIESVQLWCTNECLCSGSHEREMGREWVWFVFLSDWVFDVTAHLCSKCLQIWTLWLYSSVLPMITGGTTHQDTRKTALLYPGQEGTQSYRLLLLFLFCFFLFLDWTRVYLFGNKLCDSVTISMHAFLFVLYRNSDVLN